MRRGDANDAAGDARPGVTGRIALFVVRAAVDDDGSADDRVRAAQRDQLILHANGGLAAVVGGDVAEIADVPLLGMRPAVLLLFGVEMSAVALGIGGGAIAELVDVEAVLAGRQTADDAADLHAVLGGREVNDSLDVTLAEAVNDGDGLRRPAVLGLLFFFAASSTIGTASADRAMTTFFMGHPFSVDQQVTRADAGSC